MRNEVIIALVADFRAVVRKLPVAPDCNASSRSCKCVSRGKALDILVNGRGRVCARANSKEIRNEGIVELACDGRVKQQLVKCVAKGEFCASMRIEERLDSEVVARTEQALLGGVPDGKCKITKQMLHAARAPGLIGAED